MITISILFAMLFADLMLNTFLEHTAIKLNGEIQHDYNVLFFA